MAKSPKRERRVRDDATIKSAIKAVAALTGLPAKSIRLELPNGRKARSDASLANLKKKWTK
jgi:hypothetical protein